MIDDLYEVLVSDREGGARFCTERVETAHADVGLLRGDAPLGVCVFLGLLRGRPERSQPLPIPSSYHVTTAPDRDWRYIHTTTVVSGVIVKLQRNWQFMSVAPY